MIEALGPTMSEALRLMMAKIAKEKALPFESLVPNNETIETIKAARCGDVETVSSKSP